ncbi:MAG: hypothetical protein HY781_05270 [Chloroflexi bacterium]|nr:hypothetical protein [Chloroflexota bacterium]
MIKVFIDLLGWIGAAAYLVAYTLVSTKKLAGDSPIFQGLNVLGGVLLVGNSAYYRVWPSVAVNAAWAGIAVFILGRHLLRRNRFYCFLHKYLN